MAKRILTDEVYGAAPSPDGSLIAFAVHAEIDTGGTYLIEPDGTGLRRLSDFGVSPAWSPDGQYLALRDSYRGVKVYSFATGHVSTLVEGEFFESSGWNPIANLYAYREAGAIHVYDADAGEELSVPYSEGKGNPRWSPDGASLLVRGDSLTDSAPELAHSILQVDGGRPPVELPQGRFWSWSPDGSHLAYISEGCVTEDWNVYSIRADGTDNRPLTDSPSAIKEGTGWTTDGTGVVYSDLTALVAVDMESREQVSLAQLATGQLGHIHFGGGIEGDRTGRPASSFFWISSGPGGHGVCGG